MRIDLVPISTRPIVCPVLLAMLTGLWVTSNLQGDEWTPPPVADGRLASGRVVEYAIHFDRNSLDDSVRVGDSLIALTSSGALLRFALPAIRLVRERIDDEVTCIGRGEANTVLAGLADGRICRVDPATLELTDVVKLSGVPQWFGGCALRANRPAGMVVATRQTKLVVREGKRSNESSSMVHDLAEPLGTPDNLTTSVNSSVAGSLDRSARRRNSRENRVRLASPNT